MKKQKDDIYTPLDEYEKELERFLSEEEYMGKNNFGNSKLQIKKVASNFLQLKNKGGEVRI